MDKLAASYQELLSIWIDVSAIPVAAATWFSLRPDDSTAELLAKQRMFWRSVAGGLRVGVEMDGVTTNPFMPLDPAQPYTFLLELNEPAFLNLAKDLTSALTPGTKLAYTNSKKGAPLQVTSTTYQSAFTYPPKSKALNSLAVENEISGQIQELTLPEKDGSANIDTSPLSAGFYQILENGTAVPGTEYYQASFADAQYLYAIIKIIQNPVFLSGKPADRTLTISFNPK